MSNEESHGRVARIGRKTKRYRCESTDEEWERIAPLMPEPERRGRSREVDLREVINAVRRSGCDGGCCLFTSDLGKRFTVTARRFLFPAARISGELGTQYSNDRPTRNCREVQDLDTLPKFKAALQISLSAPSAPSSYRN